MPNEYHLAMQQRGVLSPELPVPVDQLWFWSEPWQQREREADEDIAHGRIASFDDVEDFLADLDACLKEP